MVRLHAPDLDVSERIYLGVVAENEFAMMDVVSEYLYSQKEESNKKAYRKSYVSRCAHEWLGMTLNFPDELPDYVTTRGGKCKEQLPV